MSSNGTGPPRTSLKQSGQGPEVIVFGQVARGLILVVDAVPDAGRPAAVATVGHPGGRAALTAQAGPEQLILPAGKSRW